MNDAPARLGPHRLDTVVHGDSRALIPTLPDDSVDVVVTSPPYWGQRISSGLGVEEDPRAYLEALAALFGALLPKLHPQGILWLNLGDAYNTPVNWRVEDRQYSTLGADGEGLGPENSAYVKPRAKRRAFTERGTPWLSYGNLLDLPHRLVAALCDRGWLYRGEVIWRKRNAMPEGRCRRPHRQHEPILLLARGEGHRFRVKPPVPSVWDFPNERIPGRAHHSRFPTELPRRCIEAYGDPGPGVTVLDPFAGSGTTGLAALALGCRFLGFEIDPEQARAAAQRLRQAAEEHR
jgi:DNA modification methylase